MHADRTFINNVAKKMQHPGTQSVVKKYDISRLRRRMYPFLYSIHSLRRIYPAASITCTFMTIIRL